MKRILVVDDELDICLLLERFLSKHGYAVETASDARKGLQMLEKETYDLVISDFRLPDMNGLDFLKESKRINSLCKVIIITGYSDIRMAVEVIKFGAVDYITKPLYPEELLSLVKESLSAEPPQAQDEVKAAHNSTHKSKTKTAGSTDIDAYLVGKSESAVRVHQNIELVAPTPLSVIILGETGTGKEFVAKRIHELSDRSAKPFVAIDCGALPKDIAGSEFFGHEQGAFTGAVKSKDGKFKYADAGTLFLDEVGNLSYEVQVKLLRVLQEHKYTRIGGSKDIDVDVRIIAATNENLKDAVNEGRFREDLYYRLNEFSITVAPLRDRSADIEVFATRFVEQANRLLSRNVKHISDAVWEKFGSYPWPGNLRELRNVIKRCVLLTQGDTIALSTLPEEIAYGSSLTAKSGYSDQYSLKEAAEEAERDKIVKVLAQTGNNKSKAARMLNIDRKTLYNKLKTYDI